MKEHSIPCPCLYKADAGIIIRYDPQAAWEVLIRTAACACLALIFLGTSVVHARGAVVSLDQAVRTAVGNNLSLRAATFTPAVSATDIRRARAVYNPRFTAALDHSGSNSQAAPDSFFVERSRSVDANFSADMLLSTGATASASFANPWRKDNLGTSFSRFAQPDFSLSLSQPILQGLGKEVTERGITVAEFATESSIAGWRSQALTVSGITRDRYFSVIKARENLQTRKASLALANEIHASNEGRVRAGVLAAVELLDSRLGVAQREKDLLAAEKTALDEADTLLVLMNMPPNTALELAQPEFSAAAVDRSEEGALKKAFAMRPDILQAKINLRSQEFSSKIGRNLLLPSLALKGSAGVSGLAQDYGSAFDDMRSGKYPSWAVGLEFSYPLGNDAAEADLAKNRLLAGQSRVQIRSLEETAGLEVRQAIRNLETLEKQIAVARRSVELAEARFDSYVKRGKVGLATTKDIFQVESDLTAARESLTAALADYQVGVTRFWTSTGELLERHGIRIEDREIENIAWKGLQ
ncbi:MAG: TolC family protein [Deltaproteobacteria bacterium]|nr:TolC family protein [Deltaproteobacteria bacterium]